MQGHCLPSYQAERQSPRASCCNFIFVNNLLVSIVANVTWSHICIQFNDLQWISELLACVRLYRHSTQCLNVDRLLRYCLSFYTKNELTVALCYAVLTCYSIWDRQCVDVDRQCCRIVYPFYIRYQLPVALCYTVLTSYPIWDRQCCSIVYPHQTKDQ